VSQKLTIQNDPPHPKRSKAPSTDDAGAWWALQLVQRLEAFVQSPSMRTKAMLDTLMADYMTAVRLGEVEPPTVRRQ
jgi:hypothetical protein